MREQIQIRLQELKKELAVGQDVLTELETRQQNTRNTLLRISGAIQALEDLLHQTSDEDRANGDRKEPATRRVAAG